MKTFKAFRVFEEGDKFVRRVVERHISELPDNDVLIKVHYSGVNYKDALSASGNKGVTKVYPHTPGIDAAGVVESDRTGTFQPGTKVVVMGYDLGMNISGGFGEYICVPAEWVVPLPKNFSLEETMLLGTSGFTAAIGVYKLRQMGQMPELGPMVVTGATGGVGSYAVQILSKLGYEVWAASGKCEDDYLKELGATKVIKREEVDDHSAKYLLRPRWAGAFDTVGGNVLHTLLKACAKSGSVVTCGNVGGVKLDMTVLPFILNGVNLLGINAADTPMAMRLAIWDKLSHGWKPDHLAKVAHYITLDQLDESIDQMLQGKHKGRFVLKY
ncbi:MAG: YhdH/YhfP family quinone oxidoreductase [Tannerellaceae bacterium]